jgi:hypothetical protein
MIYQIGSRNDVDVTGSPRPVPPLVLLPHVSPTAAKPESSLRCKSCDIGFSHLSNLMAHKKFYCRGLQSVGAERCSP